MSEGRESGSPTTLIGLVATGVAEVGAFYLMHDILATIVDVLRMIAPGLATQPIAEIVLVAILSIVGLLMFWMWLHFTRKPSGRYPAPKPKRNSASAVQRRAERQRRGK